MGLPTLTILADQREQRPLPFPTTIDLATSLPSTHAVRKVAIRVERKRLTTADYILNDLEGVVYQATSSFSPPCVVVETKRSLGELAGNVLDPTGRARFIKLLARMRECHAGWIVVEGGLSTLYAEPPKGRVGGQAAFNPTCARDHFLSLCCQWRIHPYILEGSGVSARARAADFVARLLVYGGAPDAKDLQPVVHPKCGTRSYRVLNSENDENGVRMNIELSVYRAAWRRRHQEMAIETQPKGIASANHCAPNPSQ
jgi:hypothetical protein